MMIKVVDRYTKIWLSAADTYNWAHRPGSCWPGSQLSSRKVFAELAPNGDLVDLVIDGGKGEQDCDGNELNAILNDAELAREQRKSIGNI